MYETYLSEWSTILPCKNTASRRLANEPWRIHDIWTLKRGTIFQRPQCKPEEPSLSWSLYVLSSAFCADEPARSEVCCAERESSRVPQTWPKSLFLVSNFDLLRTSPISFRSYLLVIKAHAFHCNSLYHCLATSLYQIIFCTNCKWVGKLPQNTAMTYWGQFIALCFNVHRPHWKVDSKTIACVTFKKKLNMRRQMENESFLYQALIEGYCKGRRDNKGGQSYSLWLVSSMPSH